MGTPTDKPTPAIASDANPPRVIPEFSTDDDGAVQVICSEPGTLERLYGVKTQDAASGLVKSAMNALGRTGELRLKFQVQHPPPNGHRMLRWTDDTNTSMARNVA